MNLRSTNNRLPEVTSESLLSMGETWDTEAVSELIRSKCDHDETPAFLFLGQKEAGLLTEHLAQVFGEDAVVTLHDTYYMGLDVIVIEDESHISTGGRKAVRTLQDPISRRPAWREADTSAQWQFRIA